MTLINSWRALRRREVAMLALLVFTLGLAAAPAWSGEARLVGADDRTKASIIDGSTRIELDFFKQGMVLVEIKTPLIDSDLPTYMTLPDALRPAPISHDEEQRVIASDLVRVEYSSDPFTLSFMNAAGERLLRLTQEWSVSADGSYRLVFQSGPGDRLLGLGEPFPGSFPLSELKPVMGLDRRGSRLEIWNRHRPPSELTLPFALCPRGYGLLIENPYRATLDLSADKIVYDAAGGPMRFWVFAGEPYPVLDAYAQLTGRTPMPPRWAAGYMQSRYGYKDEADFRALMENFRGRELPCDALIFDLYWYGLGENDPDGEKDMGALRWQPDKFPDPQGLLDDMEAQGFKAIVIIQPYVTGRAETAAEVRERGLAAAGPDGEPYTFNFWAGKDSVLLDYLNPATNAWYGDKLAAIHATGVDGWWTDLNEPERDDAAMVFHGGFSRDYVHNLTATHQHQGMAELYQDRFPDERLFILSRGGFIGDWRYGAGIWSGDVNSSWGHLRQQVPIGLSAGLSGYGLWNSDVGGFHGKPSPELFTRWMQFGAFCPIFRAHGNHQPREPWAFGDATEKNLRQLLNLRYRLVPYLYTLFHELNAAGKPVMRALFLEFPDDRAALDQNREFMYGPWLLVAPMTAPGRGRKVYLPAGTWTDFWTEETIAGPKTIWAAAPLDRVPLFVREGAILPMGPAMQHTGQKPTDPLILHLYAGPEASSYEIYEDDGASNQYLRGAYAITTVTIALRSDTVVSVERHGRFAGMVSPRSYVLVLHGVAAAPLAVKVGERSLTELPAPPGEEVPLVEGWFYDQTKRTVVVALASAPESFAVEVVAE